MTDQLPDRGHNMPPELLPVLPPEPAAEAVSTAVESLKPRVLPPYDLTIHTAFKLRVDAFADACGKWRDLKVIQTAEQAEKLTDFISGARGIAKQIEENRKAEKGIWDAKGAEVQKAYVGLMDVMTRAIETVKPLQADWLKREQDRIDAEKAEAARIASEKAEEAARLAAEAAARNDVAGEVEAERLAKDAAKEVKAAARPTSAKAGSASGGGRAMALRTVRTAEIHSFNAVYMHFREDPDVRALLQSKANAAIRSGVEFDSKILTVKTERVAA
ncbi:MAG: hypothetical protein LCH61_12000 [Proteobacteria bacterium]|nr:hypothetical protein [Pseudomonadota bacterium]